MSVLLLDEMCLLLIYVVSMLLIQNMSVFSHVHVSIIIRRNVSILLIYVVSMLLIQNMSVFSYLSTCQVYLLDDMRLYY